MNKILISLLFILGTSLLGLSQPNFEWAISGGTSNGDETVEAIFDNFGYNYSLVNNYTPSSPSSIVSLNLTKRSETGTVVWSKNINNGIRVRGATLTTDAAGNIYIAGTFKGTADFNPNAGVNNLSSNGNDDNFIVKLGTDGTFIWAKSYGGTGDERIEDIEVDINGNIFLIGSYNSTVDFDPGVGTFNSTSNGTFDAFVQKLNSNGDFLWAKTIGGIYTDLGSSITIDQNGDVVTTGAFLGTVDLDPGLGESLFTSNQGADFFILKLDTDGNHIWSKWVGGPGNSTNSATDIKSTPSNDLYLTGSFYNTVDFDPNGGVHEMTASSPSGDCFILKLNALGEFEWAHNFGVTGGYGFGYSIALDDNENVYTVGVFEGTIDFDPDITNSHELSSTDQNYFLLKLDNAGSFDWVISSTEVSSIGASAYSVQIDDDLNILIAGAFYGTRDFDFGTNSYEMTSNGGYDHYTLFLSSECIPSSITPDLATLPNITNECSVTSLTAPTATNSCGEEVLGTHNTSLPITTQGTTVVTWTFDDGNGNTSTQTQNVVINDVTAPVADVASLTDVTSECEVTSLTAPTATDNCAGSITGTHNATLPITSSTTVTWTYDDGNGNTSTQTQNVVIDDITAPVADAGLLSDINSECSVASLTAPTATDNCVGSITGTHNAILPITSSTTVTWTYDDGNGNTSTQTQNVVIDDVTVPVADVASLTDVTSECEVTSLSAPTATDNCAGSITGTHNASLPITTQGTTVVTWTYDDGNGNTSTQTQNVVIDDVTAPVADVATLTDVTSECEVTSLSTPMATDNCAGSITGTHNATFPITSNATVTWTYDDGNGNTSTQTQNVIITPIDNGITQVDGITLSADASGYNYQWVDCNNGNAPISGATSQTFVATNNGNFAVEVDNGTCTVTSTCMLINQVGISELVNTNLVEVYPNPTSGAIHITSPVSFTKVEVLNAQGQGIETNQLSETNEYSLTLPAESGVYFVKVYFKESIVVERIVKE